MDLKWGAAIIVYALLLGGTPSLCQPGTRQEELASHMRKAQEELREKRPDLAIQELQAAVAIDSENVEAQGNLGVLLFFQARYAAAIPHLQAALARQSGLPNIQGLLGIAQLRTSNVVEGRKNLEAAFPALTEKKFKIQAGLELVGLYTRSGALDEAASVIAQLRRIDPGNAEVLYAAYRTYSDLSSESTLALALAAPASAQMYQAMAHELVRHGDVAGAIADFRKALAADARLPGLHFELAEALHASSDPKVRATAEQEYQAAVLANPLDAKASARLGDIAAARGDLAGSAGFYKRALESQPGNEDAAVAMEGNDAAAALPLLEQVLANDPSNTLAHYRLSAVYRALKRPSDAKRELEEYQKYKAMKEKLGEIYKDLRLKAPGDEAGGSG